MSVDARIVYKILRWAVNQCSPMAETVADELRRIGEVRGKRSGLLAMTELEKTRHDEAIEVIIDKGLEIQRECRHWDTVGTTHTGFACNHCGKKW